MKAFSFIHVLLLCFIVINSHSKIYYQDDYLDQVPLHTKWIQGQGPIHPKTYTFGDDTVTIDENSRGTIKCSAPDGFSEYDDIKNYCWGMRFEGKDKHFSASTIMDEAIDFQSDSQIIIQFIVEIGFGVKQGSAALTLIDDDYSQEQYGDDTPYFFKFGPKVKDGNFEYDFEITRDGKRGIWKLDHKPQGVGGFLYKLILRSNGVYDLFYDSNHVVQSGQIDEDFEFIDVEERIPEAAMGVGFNTDVVGEGMLAGFIFIGTEDHEAQEHKDKILEHLERRNHLMLDVPRRKQDNKEEKEVKEDL